LLLADEPTGNLDPDTGSDILDLLMQLNSELGTTLVMATHNMDLARRMPRCLKIADQQVVDTELTA
jgi:putative ABC transport system ATP-binding protein